MLSCEKSESIVDFPIYPSKLVLNCVFNEDSLWRFQISKSLSVLDNSNINLIDTANIKLYEDDVLIEDLSQSLGDGIYFGNSKPKPNKQYRVEVSVDTSFTDIEAKAQVPLSVQISQINYVIIDSHYYDDEWGYSYGSMEADFNIEIDDDVSSDNYYSITAYYKDTMYFDDSSSYEVYNTQLGLSSEDVYIDDASEWGEVIFSDELFNGQKVSVKVNVNIWDYKPGMKLYWTLKNHSEDYYMYKKTFNVYQSVRGNPFAEPVQVFSNIENGYGIFAGFAATVQEIQMN